MGTKVDPNVNFELKLKQLKLEDANILIPSFEGKTDNLSSAGGRRQDKTYMLQPSNGDVRVIAFRGTFVAQKKRKSINERIKTWQMYVQGKLHLVYLYLFIIQLIKYISKLRTSMYNADIRNMKQHVYDNEFGTQNYQTSSLEVK